VAIQNSFFQMKDSYYFKLFYIKSSSARVNNIINMRKVYASKSKFEPARVIELYDVLIVLIKY